VRIFHHVLTFARTQQRQVDEHVKKKRREIRFDQRGERLVAGLVCSAHEACPFASEILALALKDGFLSQQLLILGVQVSAVFSAEYKVKNRLQITTLNDLNF